MKQGKYKRLKWVAVTYSVLDLVLEIDPTTVRCALCDEWMYRDREYAVSLLKEFPVLADKFKKGCGKFSKDSALYDMTTQLGYKLELVNSVQDWYIVKGESCT